ncbi:Amidase [Candidatus Promineifilum breve]|uniref:Amidase n=1 Tax=Candidatus Promineifilum breve TaxID=1806508 RepID=A0A170PGX9_9CHLR|nr:amidase [Candidatus Promineifilum breve]CUS04007.2 Amidase [Candidatus Promineifilum breve]
MTLDLMTYLDELEQLVARREPEVLALLPEAGRFDRLRREASDLLRRYPDPMARPPLFGALVGVKDIFHVDGFVTHAGSELPPELFAGPEASCVTALRAAGALILGKTVTTQFAYFAPGPTRHPLSAALGEMRTPGGSSSGSAAAVAAGFAPLALGTQTIGSIIRPAAFCGVVGFKPSFGRVATDGVIPLSPSADTVGWLAATIEVAGLAASLLIGDWRAEEPSPQPSPTGRGSQIPLPSGGVRGGQAVVLGIPEGPYLMRASAAGLAHFRAVVARLAAAGYVARPVPAMADYDDIHRRHSALVAYEAARTHADWFAAYRDRYHPRTAELIERGRATSDAQYREALDGRTRLRDEFHALMDAHAVDLWIAPAAVGPALRGLDSTGDPVMALPWTHAGLPALSLPAGTDAAGWPLGLQVVGRFGADEQLLHWGGHIASGLR